MKNKLFKVLTLGATIFSSLALTACGESSTPADPTTSAPSSSETTPSTSEKEFHQYVDDVKLKLDYTGKDFYKDGIGQVTLKSGIDGDTAHFYPIIKETSSAIIKSRFYGIDTPESTGKVQEWGKPASKFTTEKLEKANKNGTIVVSTPGEEYQKPIPDSTGSRYISLVWINETKKNAPIDELKLVNLWIVQEGLSNVKNVQQIPEYAQIFYDAEQQAKDFKLNMFSGEKDPYFNYGDYETVSLLDIKKEIEACLKDKNRVNAYDNHKVTIQGTVSGYANKILYLQNFYTDTEGGRYTYNINGQEVKGEFAGINIFTGAGTIPTKFTKENAYIQVSGLVQDGQFGFQMTDAKFKVLPKNEDDAQVIIKPEDNTDEHKLYQFDRKAADVDAQASSNGTEYLFSKVNVEEVLTCNDFYKTDNGQMILSFEESKFEAFVSFIYKGDPEKPNEFWDKKEDFVGKKFKLSGVYTYHKTARGKIDFQLCPSSSEDLVWVK